MLEQEHRDLRALTREQHKQRCPAALSSPAVAQPCATPGGDHRRWRGNRSPQRDTVTACATHTHPEAAAGTPCHGTRVQPPQPHRRRRRRSTARPPAALAAAAAAAAPSRLIHPAPANAQHYQQRTQHTQRTRAKLKVTARAAQPTASATHPRTHARTTTTPLPVAQLVLPCAATQAEHTHRERRWWGERRVRAPPAAAAAAAASAATSAACVACVAGRGLPRGAAGAAAANRVEQHATGAATLIRALRCVCVCCCVVVVVCATRVCVCVL